MAAHPPVEAAEVARLMVACPLCILGIPQEDHTPDAWFAYAANPLAQAVVARYNMDHPGLLPEIGEEQ